MNKKEVQDNMKQQVFSLGGHSTCFSTKKTRDRQNSKHKLKYLHYKKEEKSGTGEKIKYNLML